MTMTFNGSRPRFALAYRLLAAAFMIAAFGHALRAQCSPAPAWPTTAGSGANNIAFALVADPAGGFAAAGRFSHVTSAVGQNVSTGRVAQWNGTVWSGMWPSPGGDVLAITRLHSGDVVIGGGFLNVGTSTVNYIAQGAGWSWSSAGLGGGMNGPVDALATAPNGDLLAGGRFSTAGGVPCSCVARHDGSTWHSLGGGVNGTVTAVLGLANGDILASGSFTVAYNASGAQLPVPCNGIARWNGTVWQALGGGIAGYARALRQLDNGDLVVAGAFWGAGGGPAANIARWDGTSWLALGAGLDDEAFAMTLFPNGDLLVGGQFTAAGGPPAAGLARWDGSNWTAVSPGVGCNGDRVNALATLRSGEIAVSGHFCAIGGGLNTNIAVLSTTCRAQVQTIPTTCVGPAGPITLTGTRPWTGTRFESRASGFAASALGATVLGFGVQAPVPLPNGLSNCDQLAPTDAVSLVFPQNGEATFGFSLPNDSAFAGLRLSHQFIQLELDAQSSLVSLSSSNGLDLTIGTF